MCTEVMHKFLPHFEPTDLNKDFLSALQDFAYAKERHMHFSSLAIYLSLAKIPFYLYNIVRDQPFCDLLTFEKTYTIDINNFSIFHRDSPVLDIRTLDENNNLISVYDKIFFN